MRDARRVSAGLALACAWALAACGLPEGPQPIVWDREPCTHCRMLISDPHFAAQLHTADGTVASFDDPGCLLAYVQAREPQVHALWFHHVSEDRWIPGSAVGFERAGRTPMDFGLGAVDAGTPGALSLEQAQAGIAAGERSQ
jgi:copper chaperone NosL